MGNLIKGILFSAFTGFAGFIYGIAYTVQAAENSALVKVIAVIKGLFGI